MKINELFEDNISAEYGLGYDDCFIGVKPNKDESDDYIAGWNDCSKNGEFDKGSIAKWFNSQYKKQAGFVNLTDEKYSNKPLGYMEVTFRYNGEYSDDEYRNSSVHVIISDGDENLVYEDTLDSERFDMFLKELESNYGIKGYWSRRADFRLDKEGTLFSNNLNKFFEEYEKYFQS